MKKNARYIMAFVMMLFCIITVIHAQTGFFVPKQGKVFFSGNSATIFSNVLNQGQLGVGKGAVVNFKGKQWENDPLAVITDESSNGNGITGQGGIIRFLVPDTSLPPLFNQQQILIGGYNAATRTGPSFANITIDNQFGVMLSGASTKVRRELHFSNGSVYATDNILVVGDGYPGSITGYDESHFVVTGTSVTGGFLLRERISEADDWVTFPVGSADGRYTPAALQTSSGVPDDFFVRAFDGVTTGAITGQDMAGLSVNKTWQIGKRLYPGLDNVSVVLQHQLSDEGAVFKANRQNAYVSQYAGGAWDTGYPQVTPGAGTLTSGSPVSNGGTNTRTFSSSIAASSFFTKLTGKGDTSLYRTKLWFSAYRTDYLHVWVFWTTNPEIDQKYFVVQRRLSNESGFSNRDTVASKAVNGISFSYLNYGITDPNRYTGVSFYRLLSVAYNGDTSYSNVVPVGPDPNAYGVVIWPNPNDGHFNIGISALGAIKTIVIYNDIGQRIHIEEVNNRGLIPEYLRLPGAYMVSFIGYDGTVYVTKKVIVGHHD